jgi:hypothetical protein
VTGPYEEPTAADLVLRGTTVAEGVEHLVRLVARIA